LITVNTNGLMIEHAHYFKCDLEVVTAAINSNPKAFQYVA